MDNAFIKAYAQDAQDESEVMTPEVTDLRPPGSFEKNRVRHPTTETFAAQDLRTSYVDRSPKRPDVVIPEDTVIDSISNSRTGMTPAVLQGASQSLSSSLCNEIAEDVLRTRVEATGLSSANPQSQIMEQRLERNLRQDRIVITQQRHTNPPRPHFQIEHSQESEESSSKYPQAEGSTSLPPQSISEKLSSEENPEDSVSLDKNVRCPLYPQWEVDCFSWPSICEKILEEDPYRFSSLAETIKNQVKDDCRVVALLSESNREGVTTITLCLVKQLLESRLRIAIVDANFTNPNIARQLGVNVQLGWNEAFNKQLSLEESAVSSLQDSLVLFPLREQSSLDVSNRTLTSNLVTRLQNAFDLVIIDCGSEMLSHDSNNAGLFGQAVSSSIVVQNVMHTSRESAICTWEKLSNLGMNPLGIAQNYVSQQPADHLFAGSEKLTA